MNWTVPDYDYFFVFLDLVILFGFRAFGLVTQDKSVSKLIIHSSSDHDDASSLCYLPAMWLNMITWIVGNLPSLVPVDLQKAFATLNHDILLQKLFSTGISDSATSWFRTYLTDRGKFVDSVVSALPLWLSPRVLILGPLLFLLYVNDIVSMATAIDAHCKLYICRRFHFSSIR